MPGVHLEGALAMLRRDLKGLLPRMVDDTVSDAAWDAAMGARGREEEEGGDEGVGEGASSDLADLPWDLVAELVAGAGGGKVSEAGKWELLMASAALCANAFHRMK